MFGFFKSKSNNNVKVVTEGILKEVKHQEILANKIGFDKTEYQSILKCQDIIDSAEAMKKLGTIVKNSVYQESEYNWAAIGGAAEAIGGIGAGIAAATEAQLNNVHIRANNAKNREWGKNEEKRYFDTANKVLKDLPNNIILASELNKKYCIDESFSNEELFNEIYVEAVKINSYDNEYDINDNYSEYFIEINSKNFKNKDCYIDGSVVLELYKYKTDELLGTSFVNLPIYGTSSNEKIVKSILINEKIIKGTTCIKFKPNKLWIVRDKKLKINKNILSKPKTIKKNYENDSIVKDNLSKDSFWNSVYIGKYPQEFNGKLKEIEWKIIECSEEKMLLLSKDVIDVIPFLKRNDKRKNVSYKDSNVREFLNKKFISTAFNKDELKNIIEYEIEDNVKDKIFILSENEIEKYLPKDKRDALAVDCVLNKFDGYDDYDKFLKKCKNGSCIWPYFIREDSVDNEISLLDCGRSSCGGFPVDDEFGDGVRPAMWYKIK